MKVPEPRKLKSGNYFIQLRLNGVSVPVTASTAKECKRQAELIKAEHRAGKRDAMGLGPALSLDKAISNYIDSRRNVLSPSTIRGYEIIRKNRFQAQMKEKLNAINWQSAINAETKVCGPKTLKNAWGLIVSVLAYHQLHVPKVKLPQMKPAEKEWLEPEQIPVFVQAVATEPCAIPALLALHGLRRSEIYALDWDAININANTITVKGAVVPDENHKFVRKETTKNISSRRTVPIVIPELAVLLAEAQAAGTDVVSGSPNTLCHRINRVCEKVGLPPVGVHGLRHSFASLGYHLGIPEREMMELGGWSDNATMQKIYTHIAKADRLKNENKLAEYFKNANKNANEF